MLPSTTNSLGRVHRLVDRLLRWLIVAAAFLLGCEELFDPDVWWHVRAGQWIWANRKIPVLDPFTFSSADRPWIDLHWTFQLLLTAAHAAGGVRGLVLMAAIGSGAVLLVGLAARDRRWPMWMIAACWLPALLTMSGRFAPRPELLSLLGVATYLAVLFRTDDTPALAWILAPVQVLWVNAHGLFVLGPFIMGAYLIDHIAGAIARSRTSPPHSSMPEGLDAQPSNRGGAWWWHVGGATAAACLACLVNPYGLRGTLFPLELFPKLTAWGGPYKTTIVELMDLGAFVQRAGPGGAGSNVYVQAECFLLWILPISFIVPAVWRLDRSRVSEMSSTLRLEIARRSRAAVWFGALGFSAGLILICVLGFPGVAMAPWLVWPGLSVPVGLIVLGICGAAVLGIMRSPPPAVLLAAVGGVAVAAWVVWLRADLFGPEPGIILGAATALLGSAAAVLTLRAGGRGRLFRLILALAFGYLAIQSYRNMSFFGLVAGFVLAWNLGEWAADLETGIAAKRPLILAGLLAPLAVACVIGLLIAGVVADSFTSATGGQRRFGTRESPLVYAHEAARFAGRPGLPDRALVLDLRQAAVYLFHNGPERKLFMDGRLEVSSRSTFDTFLRLRVLLNDGRPGWAEPVRRMGDPLILLDHVREFGAEATLLADPAWRCIYYDPIASIFVSRRRRELEPPFPDVDFAARHFDASARQAVTPAAWGIGEAKALFYLGSALQHRPGAASHSSLRLSLMLLAGDRLRQAVASAGPRFGSDPAAAGLWLLLGHCSWNLMPDLTDPPAGPDEAWDPARGLLPAQAAFCYRRAVELDPGSIAALTSLHDSYKARRIRDAQRSVAARMRFVQTAANQTAATEPARAKAEAAEEPLPAWESREGLEHAIDGLLENGRAETVVRLFAEAEHRGVVPSWQACDRTAAALLHLGRPAEAQRVWERAADPPSPSLKLARLATASLAALDFPTAERTYRAALEHDATSGEAWVGLTLLYIERGEAGETLTAARVGLRHRLTAAQRSWLTDVEVLVARLVPAR